MTKLIKSGEFNSDTLLRLVELGVIEVNEQLRPGDYSQSGHYTPLFAALVSGEFEEQHLEQFGELGAFVDNSLVGWEYAIARQPIDVASELMEMGQYEHVEVKKVAHLAFYNGNVELFSRLADDVVLSHDEIGSLIQRLDESANYASDSEDLMEVFSRRLDALQRLPSLSPSQSESLENLESTFAH